MGAVCPPPAPCRSLYGFGQSRSFARRFPTFASAVASNASGVIRRGAFGRRLQLPFDTEPDTSPNI